MTEDEIKRQAADAVCGTLDAQRDQAAAMDLYRVVDAVNPAYPRLSASIEESAEALLRANELRIEGAVDALRQP